MSQVFLVIVTANAEAVRQKLEQAFPGNEHFVIDEDKFTVAFDGVSRDVAEKLGIRGDEPVGSGVVFPITSYSGRADPALWEWLGMKIS
jgi:hypothetical protein